MARNQQGIRAGKAFVELSANDSRLIKGLRSAQRRLMQFGQTVTGMGARLLGVGAGFAAPIIAATKNFADFGDAVNKMSARTGLSAEAVSGLGFAAEQSGADTKTLEAGFRGMSRTILNASRGLSTAVDSFTDLGLSIENIQGLDPEQQFKLIAERISQIEDPTRKAAIAMSIFGRSGQMLIPLLDAGSAGISDMQEEARRLGITLSDDDAAAAAELTDAMNRVRRSMKAAWMSGGLVLANGMTKLLNEVSTVIPQITQWMRANKTLITTVAAAIAATTAFGGVLVVAGGALTLASVAVGALASAITLALSPMGLMLGVLTSLTTYAIRSGKAVQALDKLFPTLRSTVTEAFTAISEAIAGGDILAATRVLWAAVNLEWTKGINAISKKWTDFSTFALRTARIISDQEAQQRQQSANEEAQARLDIAQRQFDAAKQMATQTATQQIKPKVDALKKVRTFGEENLASNLVSQGGTFSSLSSREFVSMSAIRDKRPGEKIVEGIDRLTREVQGVRRLIDDFGVAP
jgi:hypothetical protein